MYQGHEDEAAKWNSVVVNSYIWQEKDPNALQLHDMLKCEHLAFFKLFTEHTPLVDMSNAIVICYPSANWCDLLS